LVVGGRLAGERTRSRARDPGDVTSHSAFSRRRASLRPAGGALRGLASQRRAFDCAGHSRLGHRCALGYGGCRCLRRGPAGYPASM